MERNGKKLPECPKCIETSLKGKSIAGSNKRGHEAMVAAKQHEGSSADADAAGATAVAVAGAPVVDVSVADEAAAVLPKDAQTCACGRFIKTTSLSAADMPPAPLVDADAGVGEEDQADNKSTKKARVMLTIDLNKLPPSDDEE